MVVDLVGEVAFRRPVDEQADPDDLKRFSDLHLVDIDVAFGGWAKAQQEHFEENGVFDQIMTRK